jgi:hypothetical protein
MTARKSASEIGPPPAGLPSCIQWKRVGRLWRVDDYFAVPDQDYFDGYRTGQRIAIEFAEWIAGMPDGGPIDAIRFIAAACRAFDTPGRLGPRGAAAGFLREVETWLSAVGRTRFALSSAQSSLARSLRDEEYLEARERAKKLDFARRMEIAKAAKARSARAASR